MTPTHYLIIGAYGLGWLLITVGPWLVGFWLVCALINAIAAPKVVLIDNTAQNEAQPVTEQTNKPAIQVVSWKAYHDSQR